MNTIISIVLGSYNRYSFLKLTINSIREELLQLNHASEIIVIDGGSTDGALEWLTQQKDLITIVQHNRGVWGGKPIERRSWGYFMNLGFKCAKGKYICMLSDDCLVVPGAIQNGYTLFEKELMQGNNIGAMAFYWRDWHNTHGPYAVYKIFQSHLFVNHGLYLKQALEAVGYINEESFMFYAADMDLCLKLKQKGYACIEAPDSYIEHYPHANIQIRASNQVTQDMDTKNFLKKWAGIFCTKEKPALGFVSIEKKFYDQNDTAKQFKHLDLVNVSAIVQRRKNQVQSFYAYSMNSLKKIVPGCIKNMTKKLLRPKL